MLVRGLPSLCVCVMCVVCVVLCVCLSVYVCVRVCACLCVCVFVCVCVYISMCLCVSVCVLPCSGFPAQFVVGKNRTRQRPAGCPQNWPLQDILLRRGICARIKHPYLPPAHLHWPLCRHTIARPLGSIPHLRDPLFASHSPYKIGDNNIVERPT